MQIKVKKLTPTAKLPTRAYSSDSGLDLHIDHDLVLQPAQLITDTSQVSSDIATDLNERLISYAEFTVGEKYLASTGIAVQLNPYIDNYKVLECQIRPKSGLSSKGLYVALGTIDNSYTGELKIVLINLSNEVIYLKQGDKIAQLVVQEVYLPQVVEVEELEERDRSCNGFGSTGA